MKVIFLFLFFSFSLLYGINDTSIIDISPINLYGGYNTKLSISDGGNLYRFSTDYHILKYIFFIIIGKILFSFYKSKNFKMMIKITFLSILFYLFAVYITNKNSSSFNLDLKEFNDKSTRVQTENFNSSRNIKFKDIYSFQILDAKTSYSSKYEVEAYELNVILKDYRRIKLSMHSDYDIIYNQASKISEVLNKPILDQTK